MTPAASQTADARVFSAGRATPPVPLAARLRRFATEPLVHFALIGVLLFAGDRLLSRTVEAPVIDVSASRQREFAKLFEQRQGRGPTDAERTQLVQRYVEDEALFREGLRLSLVNTDPMLRAQVIARVRRMLQTEVEQKLPAGASQDERKRLTARAFQTEVTRLASQWRVKVEDSR